MKNSPFPPETSFLEVDGAKISDHWDFLVKVRIYESASATAILVDALGVLFGAFELENDAISTIAKKWRQMCH